MSDLLAIEASSSLCSVALSVGNEIQLKMEDGERTHTQFLLPFVDGLLSEQKKDICQLAAIAYAAGPGSFTGIRLAASVAKSLAYAANIPVIPVSSLAAIAMAFGRKTGRTGQCLVITDARMNEVYCGEYLLDKNGKLAVIQPDRLLDLQAVKELSHNATVIVGNAGELLQGADCIRGIEFQPIAATAEDVLVLARQKLLAGEVESALDSQPVYLRDKTGWKTTAEQKR